MKCGRCKGRLLLDRVFTDNTTFEVACIHCGNRTFVGKDTEFGKWLVVQEKKIELATNGKM